MNSLFLALLLVSLVGLVIGLIKPSILKLKSRKQSVLFLGGAALLCFILFGVTSTPQTTTQKESVNTQEQKSLQENISDSINNALGSQTNMGKQRVVGVEISKYTTKLLEMYKYKNTDVVNGILVKINSDENLTTNLQKGTMHNEAAKIMQAIFPIDSNIGDIIIWSQLPVKDQYGNAKDDTAIIYSVSRALFSKINWNNFDYHDLPNLLKSENGTDDRNNYFENIKF